MLTVLFLIASAAAQTPGEVTFWTEDGVTVTTDWAAELASHSWTAACPDVMDVTSKAFSLTFTPVNDEGTWTYQVDAQLGRVGGYNYENPLTRCLETEATAWLENHPVEPLIKQEDNFRLHVSWQHPDAVREPVVREPITLPEDDCENCRLVPGDKSPATLD